MIKTNKIIKTKQDKKKIKIKIKIKNKQKNNKKRTYSVLRNALITEGCTLDENEK